MDVGEPALRDGNWEGFDLDMPVDLGLLAFCAVFGPPGDVPVDARPHKPGTKAVNREDKLSRRYRDRDLAKFESSRRYRQR